LTPEKHPPLELVSVADNPAPPGAVVARIATADGIALRVARWPASAAPRGTVAVIPGYAECIELYFEVVAELLDRRFGVVALDWRGQGLSGRPLADPRKGHVDDFAAYQNDLRALHEGVLQIFCPRPWLALGHSMGGTHLLAQAQAGSSPFTRIVLTAPLVDFGPYYTHSSSFLKSALRLAARAATAAGLGRAFAPSGVRSGAGWPFKAELLTADAARHARGTRLALARPDLAILGPTLGWTSAAFTQLARFEEPDYPASIATPISIIAAGADRLTSPAAAAAFAKELRHGEFHLIAGARHHILMERDCVRAQFWALFDAFVADVETGRAA
jgi:lysophospholipase